MSSPPTAHHAPLSAELKTDSVEAHGGIVGDGIRSAAAPTPARAWAGG